VLIKDDTLLWKEKTTDQTLFWRQKVWNNLFKELKQLVESNTTSENNKNNNKNNNNEFLYFLMMNKLIFYSPHVIVDENIAYVCGNLIRSISFNLNSHPNPESTKEINTSDLFTSLHQELKSYTIDILYKYSSILKDKLMPHLSSICSTCISIAQSSPQLTSTKIRYQSLMYLLEICTLYPYYQLFPVKGEVMRGLASIVDDKKRAIRILAAKLRNAWSVISHGQ
jgi:hypothetical protein